MSEFNPYTENFTRVYDLFWKDFIENLGSKIYDLAFEKLVLGGFNSHLDIGCGTGQLVKYMCSQGIESWGLDLSENMLSVAKRRLENEISSQKATLTLQNATTFQINKKFNFITSTFDSVNHLKDLQEVEKSFNQVKSHLTSQGCFLFDINTEKTLKGWNFVEIEESIENDIIYIMQGKYESKWKRGYSRVSGFVKNKNNNDYSRFDEIYYNTIFKIDSVSQILLDLEFHDLEYYDENLNPVKSDPEHCERVFILAFA